MGLPGYSSRNLLLNAESLTAETIAGASLANPALPISNLRDGRVGRVFRFPYKTTGKILIRFPPTALPAIDCVAVLNHNLPGDAQLQLSYSSNGSSWTVVQTFGFTELAQPTFVRQFLGAARRWWALELVSTGSTTQPMQLGELWLGELRWFPRNVEWGGVTGVEYRNLVVTGFTGHEVGYAVSESRVFEGEAARGLTPSEVAEFRSLYSDMRGNAAPFLFAPDVEGTECWIGKLRDSRMAPRNIGVNRYEGVPLNIYEVPWARPGT